MTLFTLMLFPFSKECFIYLKMPVMVRAFTTWLPFMVSFISMRFFTYLKRTGRIHTLKPLTSFDKFSYIVSHTTFSKWTRTNTSIYIFLALIGLFFSMDWLMYPPNKAGKLITCKLESHSTCLLSMGIYIYILIILRQREVHGFYSYPMLIWLISTVTYTIPINGRITKRFYIEFTVWLSLPHKHMVHGLWFLYNSPQPAPLK